METPQRRDPDWTDREAEGQPGTEDQPPGYTADTAVEGSFPPRDHPVATEDWGTTPGERRLRESLAQRVEREEPDVLPSGPDATSARAGDRRGDAVTAEAPKGGPRLAEPSADDSVPEVESPADGIAAEESALHVERP